MTVEQQNKSETKDGSFSGEVFFRCIFPDFQISRFLLFQESKYYSEVGLISKTDAPFGILEIKLGKDILVST